MRSSPPRSSPPRASHIIRTRQGMTHAEFVDMNIPSPTRECPICMEPCTPREFIKLRECGHFFHPFCLNHYVESELRNNGHRTHLPCPTCRKLFFADQIYGINPPAMDQWGSILKFN
jgi:hypothetical protein